MKKPIFPISLMRATAVAVPSNMVGYVKNPCDAGSISIWGPVDCIWDMNDKSPWDWLEPFPVSIVDGVLAYLDDDLTWPSARMKKVK
ncbi:MAG: hypothetical protein WCY21_01230 [Candidatus Cloacimonadaceae bacterium]|jgi:hypothetical protein|nr:hypothetical protein [Candidatus Cloacimonadota bacterium]MDX9949947.1 hypothetical protein [Candidatus Syntrophosphaera sp.]